MRSAAGWRRRSTARSRRLRHSGRTACTGTGCSRSRRGSSTMPRRNWRRRSRRRGRRARPPSRPPPWPRWGGERFSWTLPTRPSSARFSVAAARRADDPILLADALLVEAGACERAADWERADTLAGDALALYRRQATLRRRHRARRAGLVRDGARPAGRVRTAARRGARAAPPARRRPPAGRAAHRLRLADARLPPRRACPVSWTAWPSHARSVTGSTSPRRSRASRHSPRSRRAGPTPHGSQAHRPSCTTRSAPLPGRR